MTVIYFLYVLITAASLYKREEEREENPNSTVYIGKQVIVNFLY